MTDDPHQKGAHLMSAESPLFSYAHTPQTLACYNESVRWLSLQDAKKTVRSRTRTLILAPIAFAFVGFGMWATIADMVAGREPVSLLKPFVFFVLLIATVFYVVRSLIQSRRQLDALGWRELTRRERRKSYLRQRSREAMSSSRIIIAQLLRHDLANARTSVELVGENLFYLHRNASGEVRYAISETGIHPLD